jgi:hypothetical protein
LQLYAATSGFQHHHFTFDLVAFGPQRRLRLTLNLAWRQWRNDGYFGIGNGTTREAEYAQVFDPEDARQKRYRYSLFQPFFYGTLRANLAKSLDVFFASNIKHSTIETYAGSLLAEQRPFGMDGGWNAQAIGGVVYDTRFPELTPDGGVFAELSGRYSPPLPRGDGVYGGGFATLRAYQSLSSGVVLAERLMVEVLYGDVPFYEMVHWGGSIPTPGFGGYQTIRGVTFGRFRAPGKALANLELRIDAVAHTLFGNPVLWQLVPYLDAGSVFLASRTATTHAKTWPVHPAAGAGVRAIYQEVFIGRFDLGFGLDPVRRADGTVREQPKLGFYLVAGQLF